MMSDRHLRRKMPRDLEIAGYAWEAHGAGIHRRFDLLHKGEHAGFTVLHCGHPTAHFPWYIESVSALDGEHFHGTHRYLADAKAVAEGLATGRLIRKGNRILGA